MAGTDRGDADKKRMGTLHLLIQDAKLGGRQPKPVLILEEKAYAYHKRKGKSGTRAWK